MLRSMQHIGNRAPMHCTGIGKLLLMNHPASYINTLMEAKGLPALTKNTLTTREELIAEVAQSMRRGYAFDNEECEIGARCVAAPVYDYTGQIVAGMSVTGPIYRLNDETLTEDSIAAFLAECRALSAELGHDGDVSPLRMPFGAQ